MDIYLFKKIGIVILLLSFILGSEVVVPTGLIQNPSYAAEVSELRVDLSTNTGPLKYGATASCMVLGMMVYLRIL